MSDQVRDEVLAPGGASGSATAGEVTIVPATQADLEQLKDIEDASDTLFIERFRPAEWETADEAAERMAHGGWVLVAKVGGDVVGFVHVIQGSPIDTAKASADSAGEDEGESSGRHVTERARVDDAGPGRGIAYLDSLAVHPTHARRGIGRALVAAAQAGAVARGARTLRLRTYADVPWNGPFYASCGFRRADAPGAWWAALVEKETRMGLMQYGERIVMAWE